jgi:SAM-dependent methyltransferase
MKLPDNPGWRDFWKFNLRESCLPENPETAKQIAESWEWWFGGCADGSRVLDVATGNGIVLVHAASAARKGNKKFDLTGIDLADIAPAKYVTDLDPDVRDAAFHGSVAAENMPFDDASFDVIASQFGLEYAKPDKALAEVTRVAAPGAKLLWLAHSPDSAVVQQQLQQIDEVDYLLASRGPVYFMKNLIDRHRRHKDIRYSLDNLYAVFADAEQYRRKHPPAVIVSEVCREFAQTVDRLRQVRPDDLERMIKTAEHRLFAHKNRIRSMRSAVMTPDRLAATQKKLAKLGWSDIEIDEMRVGASNSPIGLRISATLA